VVEEVYLQGSSNRVEVDYLTTKEVEDCFQELIIKLEEEEGLYLVDRTIATIKLDVIFF